MKRKPKKNFWYIACLLLVALIILTIIVNKERLVNNILTNTPEADNSIFVPKERKTQQKKNLGFKANYTPSTPTDFTPKNKGGKRDVSQNIDLPSAFQEHEPEVIVARATAKIDKNKIWTAQDENMADWPEFESIKEQLVEELAQKIDFENTAKPELLKAALDYRSKFWSTGGNSGKESFLYAYKSRILLESLHQKYPDDSGVISELVETIQAAEPLVQWKTPAGKPKRKIGLMSELCDLRYKQFQIIDNEIQNGRKADLNDFVIGYDLAYFSARSKSPPILTTDMLDWLTANSVAGGWKGFSKLLNQANEKIWGNIYISMNYDKVQTIKYGRRSPGFKGPNTKERGLILWGPLAEHQHVKTFKVKG